MAISELEPSSAGVAHARARARRLRRRWTL